MGCWNGTCGISQLPIISGNKVKAFLLLQSRHQKEIKGSGTNYAMDYFAPFFLPVTAKYDDYGSICHIEEDWNTKFLLEKFQAWQEHDIIVNLGDKAEINNPNIDKFQTVKDVFDCVERGALLYGKDNKRKIGIFMVVEEVYNTLITHYESEFTVDRYSSEYEEETYSGAYKWFRAMRKNSTKDSLEKILNENKLCIGNAISLILGDRGWPVPEFEHYYDSIKNPEFGEPEDIIQRFKNVRRLNSCMRELRKMWIPQTGGGNQDQDFGYYKALNIGMEIYMARLEQEQRQYE